MASTRVWRIKVGAKPAGAIIDLPRDCAYVRGVLVAYQKRRSLVPEGEAVTVVVDLNGRRLMLVQATRRGTVLIVEGLERAMLEAQP